MNETGSSRNIRVGGGSTIDFTGSFGQCPECGRRAPYVDGTYSFDETGRRSGVLRPTPAQVIRLQTTFVWARDAIAAGKVEPTTIERKVRRSLEREAPGLASAVDVALSSKGASVAAWVAIVLQLLSMFSGQPEGFTSEQVVEIVKQLNDAPAQPPEAPSRAPQNPIEPADNQQPEE